MKPRLLVTGFGGFVAGSVVSHAGDAWDVHCISRRKTASPSDSFHIWNVDLLDTKRTADVFAEVRPTVIVHTAALADIDYCEAHRDEADQINYGVTQKLARLCADSGTRMVHCSTDTVFDGRKGMYTEQDAPNPVNFYGETKARSEAAVLKTVPSAVVARLSLVIGLPVLGSGNSFLPKMLATFADGKEVRVPENEIRTPVDVITLGNALLELASNDFTGIIHLSGESRLTRADMARQIAVRMGYSPGLVVPVDSNSIAGRAARPTDVSLDNARAEQQLDTPMLGLADALELILATKEAGRNVRSHH